MPTGEPPVGATSTVQRVVEEADLASALRLDDSDSYPGVFATARMIAIMEIAAGRVLQPFLVASTTSAAAAELSVGVDVNVRHLAATSLGDTATATARYLGREGKLYKFEVSAADSAGEIGRGFHTRAVVTTERLLAGARKRTGVHKL